jgi:hypothetical protein
MANEHTTFFLEKLDGPNPAAWGGREREREPRGLTGTLVGNVGWVTIYCNLSVFSGRTQRLTSGHCLT